MEGNFVTDKLPFFSPLNKNEMKELCGLFYEIQIKEGGEIGPQKGDILYFVKEGFFQSEGVLQKSETVYLSKGSIIGSLPFSKDRMRGEVKAVSPSVLYAADIDSLYRFFLSHFPATRGYLRVVGKSGIPLSESGAEILSKSAKVISVCGHNKNSGKTIASLFLAKKLSGKGNVVICDMSSSGMSVFDYCSKKLSPPLVQKKEGEKNDDYFRERITDVEKGISLLNVSFGSNVSADASVVSPLICYLSSRYNYVIMDIDGADEHLTSEAMAVSDFVIPVCRTIRDEKMERDRYSGILNDGQILITAVRESSEDSERPPSRVVIPSFSFKNDDPVKDIIFGAAEDYSISIESLSKERDYLSFTTGGMRSLYYAGLIPHIGDHLKSGNIVYSHSFAYALISLFLGTSGGASYFSKVRKLFREERLEALVKYSYPGDSLMKSEPLLSWASEITGMSRIEDFYTQMVTSQLDSSGETRIASAGLLREAIAAALCRVPPCPFVKSSTGAIGASSPVSETYMFRHPVGKTISYSVRGKDPEISSKRIKSAVRFGFLSPEDSGEEKWLSDRNIIIDVNNKRFNIKGLINDSGKLWESALSSY